MSPSADAHALGTQSNAEAAHSFRFGAFRSAQSLGFVAVGGRPGACVRPWPAHPALPNLPCCNLPHEIIGAALD